MEAKDETKRLRFDEGNLLLIYIQTIYQTPQYTNVSLNRLILLRVTEFFLPKLFKVLANPDALARTSIKLNKNFNQTQYALPILLAATASGAEAPSCMQEDICK